MLKCILSIVALYKIDSKLPQSSGTIGARILHLASRDCKNNGQLCGPQKARSHKMRVFFNAKTLALSDACVGYLRKQNPLWDAQFPNMLLFVGGRMLFARGKVADVGHCRRKGRRVHWHSGTPSPSVVDVIKELLGRRVGFFMLIPPSRGKRVCHRVGDRSA